MSEKLTAAVEELQAQLAQQLEDVSETKKMINALRKRMGEEPLYPDVAVEQTSTIRPDQFYGKPLATAAQEYLERRKQACPAEEIIAGLEKGGFDFDGIGYKANHRLRNVSISLAKNTAKFHRLPNGTFGLLAWYDQAMIRRQQQQQPAKENGSVTEETTNGAAAEKASA